ncbi:hypothetical protein NP233_g7248 [Leucocoprinus birnbaumii]|uniref:Uncharacterized protein n=1 Tax=Leucocoprinus birnbaumii TaxID=56174 RepID=A0AAD5VPL2_9AGAR|nr:hypothetical protein NP233_g7248 [Leucocoprinus birnbaumii]
MSQQHVKKVRLAGYIKPGSVIQTGYRFYFTVTRPNLGSALSDEWADAINAILEASREEGKVDGNLTVRVPVNVTREELRVEADTKAIKLFSTEIGDLSPNDCESLFERQPSLLGMDLEVRRCIRSFPWAQKAACVYECYAAAIAWLPVHFVHIEQLDAAFGRIAHIPTFGGRTDFSDRVGWKSEGRRSFLYERHAPKSHDFTDSHAPIIAVGVVLEDHHRLGPTGTYTVGSQHGNLAAARLNMALGCPEGDDRFKLAWRTTLGHLERFISAKMKNGPVNEQCRMIQGGDEPSIRFSAPLFEPKDPENPEEGDDDIYDWEVPSELQSELDALKNSHRVMPVGVFDADLRPIAAVDVPRLTLGSLVEVAFEVKHWLSDFD